MNEETPAISAEDSADTEHRNGREAAKYRRQLRDTEQQLEAAQAALTAARGQILRTALTGHKIDRDTFNVDALEDSGLDPAELFNEDGALDQDAVDTAMQQLHETKPYLFTPPTRLVIPNEGMSPEQQSPAKTWQDAFAPES